MFHLALVKEIATFGGDVSRFVSPNVKAALEKKLLAKLTFFTKKCCSLCLNDPC